MVWWSISLPFQGISLLFSRTFFSLQKPWATTALAGVNMVTNAIVALALYKPFGIAGIVLGTVMGTLVMTTSQGLLLRRELGGIEGRRTAFSIVRMLGAGALLAVAAYGVWDVLDHAVGTSLGGQALSVIGGISAGIVVYGAAVWLLKVPEARHLRDLLPSGRG
jgi:putative peptidoglycan lipid II flippase